MRQKGWSSRFTFARNNAGVESPALLSSPYALLTLSYLAHLRNYQLNDAEAASLRFWLLVANGRGRYSRGSSETYLDQDLALIRSGEGVVNLLESLRQQFGRLHFDVEEFKGRNQRASVFRLMFLALKAAGATDWRSGIQIAASSYGADHKLQFHHIFPKAVLHGHFNASQINEIGNLAFIGGKTNRGISAKPPTQYLPTVRQKQGEKALIAQCVPLDPALWTLDRYSEFVAERQRLLAARVNEFLGEPG